MPNKIESVQIIRIEETEFVFDYDAVKKIIDSNPECADLPVAIVIINGALRTGKSFFINFVIRHLMRLSGEFTDSNMLEDYFRSRRGTDIQTLGIWALNKIFVHNGKAIILMDTQGIFDKELNQAMTTALICLSTLMSSYQIYNLDKRIQEDHLVNMAYFSAYTDLIQGLYIPYAQNDQNSVKSIEHVNDHSNHSKVGQTLSLLVRDWQNFEDSLDLQSCIRETETYQRDFMSNANANDPTKKTTRDKILNTFTNLNVRLCPHPGLLVTEGVFSGNMSEIRREFMLHIEYIISDMLQNLEPKKISSNMELICSDVPNFMKRYVELYRNIKDNLPEPRTILETTSKISQTSAKTNTVNKYKQIMLERIRTCDMDSAEIARLHPYAKDQAYRYFNGVCVMGETTDIENVMIKIDEEITSEYQNFMRMAVQKDVFYIVRKIFRSLMLADFAAIGLPMLIPLTIAVRVVSYIVIPAVLNWYIDYILSTLMWIMFGMIMLQHLPKEYLKNKDTQGDLVEYGISHGIVQNEKKPNNKTRGKNPVRRP